MTKREALPTSLRAFWLKQLKDGICCSFMAMLLTGCASSPHCSSYEVPVVLDSLYFGASKPEGVVTAEEWAAFVEDTVVPDFPDGLTFWTAAGRWRNAAGVVEPESSYLLQLAHNGNEEKDRAVERIAQRYKRRFQQEAVMRIRSQACQSF